MNWNNIKKGDEVHLLIPEMVDGIFEYQYLVGTIHLVEPYIEYGLRSLTVGITYNDNNRFIFDMDEYDFVRNVITVFGNSTIKYVHHCQIGDIFISFDKNELKKEYESMINNEINAMTIDIENLESRRNALKLMKEKEIF